jgi:hypothetical protein
MIDPDDAVMLLIDHQSGLFQLVRDIDQPTLRTHAQMSASTGTIITIYCIPVTKSLDRYCGPICIYCSGCRCFHLLRLECEKTIMLRDSAFYGVVLFTAAIAYLTLQQPIIASQGTNSLLKKLLETTLRV